MIPFNLEVLPIDLRKTFDRYNFFTLEIGSGWGEFALQYAGENPDHLVLALEKKKKRVIKSIKEQEKRKIENVRWMLVDVNWFFEEIFMADSFDKVIINFPDPWPKNRHNKHRFLHKKNLDTISDICKKKTALEFVTDHWAYLEEVLYILEESSEWQNCKGRGVVCEEARGRLKSFFEEIILKENKKIYYLFFRKS